MSINHLVNPNINPKLDIYANSITSTVPIVSTQSCFLASNPAYSVFYLPPDDTIVKSGDTEIEYRKQEMEIDGVSTTVVYYKESGHLSLSLLDDYVLLPSFRLRSSELPDLDSPGDKLPLCTDTSNILYSKLEVKPVTPIFTADYPVASFITTNEAYHTSYDLIKIEINNRQVESFVPEYTSDGRYFVELAWKI
jgi:hypothetical protein